MRRALRRVRETAYLVASTTAALAAGLAHGRLRATLEDDLATVEEVERRRRRYLRARRLLRALLQRSLRCDREVAEETTDMLGFTRDASASPPDVH